MSHFATPKIVEFPLYSDVNSSLCVYECGDGALPFLVSRVFVVTARSGEIRGEHAHRYCSQLLVAISGSIKVVCNNGSEKLEFILNAKKIGLLIPPKVWAIQHYQTDNSALMVLCDHKFDESEYIRDYKNFLDLVAK